MRPSSLSLSLVVCLSVAGCSGSVPPDIHGLTDQVATVGQELDLELDGTDYNGGRLTYSVQADISLAGNGTITEMPSGVGVFRWTPLAEDIGMHPFDFTVSDGSDSTTVTINIDVQGAASSAPVFRQPLGTGEVVDLSKTPCVSIDIVVEDSDTANVDIGQEEPVIIGATVMQVDGTDATWMWCPTPAQVAAQDRYTVVLSADDHDNPKTIKNFILVMSQAAPALMINEVDYDQVGNDVAEYVEIYNSTTSDVSLAGVSLVLVNGSTNTPYSTVDLSTIGTLPAQQYLVVGGTMVTPATGALKLDPLWTLDDIQNGAPDGIALIDTVSHTVVDAFSYEGQITAVTITGFPAPVSLVEGNALAAGVADSNTVNGTLCRDPSGHDTNDAATDWKFCTHVTPGAANVP